MAERADDSARESGSASPPRAWTTATHGVKRRHGVGTTRRQRPHTDARAGFSPPAVTKLGLRTISRHGGFARPALRRRASRGDGHRLGGLCCVLPAPWPRRAVVLSPPRAVSRAGLQPHRRDFRRRRSRRRRASSRGPSRRAAGCTGSRGTRCMTVSAAGAPTTPRAAGWP
jgi:hypothetical protein